MKRSGIKAGAKSLARGSTFKARTNAVKRRPRPGRTRHPERAAKERFQSAAQQQLACMNPACPNPAAPWNAHHVIYAQHVRREGGDVWDPRNAIRLCCDCHDHYHARSLRLPADVLPPAAVAFACELLGRERAAAYLDRYYSA